MQTKFELKKLTGFLKGCYFILLIQMPIWGNKAIK